MTEQFLHGADILSSLEDVGCEAVAEGMGGHPIWDPRLASRVAHGSLDLLGIDVMASYGP